MWYWYCVLIHEHAEKVLKSKDTVNPSSHHLMATPKRRSFIQALAPKKYNHVTKIAAFKGIVKIL